MASSHRRPCSPSCRRVPAGTTLPAGNGRGFGSQRWYLLPPAHSHPLTAPQPPSCCRRVTQHRERTSGSPKAWSSRRTSGSEVLRGLATALWPCSHFCGPQLGAGPGHLHVACAPQMLILLVQVRTPVYRPGCSEAQGQAVADLQG